LVLQVAGESQRYIEGTGNIINCLGAHKKHSFPSSSSMDSSIHSPPMMMMIPLSSFLFYGCFCTSFQTLTDQFLPRSKVMSAPHSNSVSTSFHLPMPMENPSTRRAINNNGFEGPYTNMYIYWYRKQRDDFHQLSLYTLRRTVYFTSHRECNQRKSQSIHRQRKRNIQLISAERIRHFHG
jgi:hypothetical protein